MTTITLIGCTGSIGKQVAAVVRRYPDRYRFHALVAHSSARALLAEVREFAPDVAVLIAGEKGCLPEKEGGTPVLYGEENALSAVDGADVVFVAASGFAGLKYSLRAIEKGKRLALANKETLVCGGEIVMRKVREKGIDLIPVDSEHSALWQALHFQRNAPYKKLYLTASGGPFYGYTKEQLRTVSVENTLCHPTWNMGAKITVDSATLLNKGLEVIEAKWLYGAEWEQIETVVQPTSIIHSMVGFADGAVLAQLSYPTMEVPIQLALTYPERLDCALPLPDFAKMGNIPFKPLVRKDFPCYDLALTAGERGDNFPCALNGAGEVAVRAFLQKKIPFTGIAEVIEETLCRTQRQKITGYADLCEADSLAKREAEEILKKWQ